MLEITTTRHNPFVDPQLAVWGWEIPVYLFFGGMIAGMMILAGAAMLRLARWATEDLLTQAGLTSAFFTGLASTGTLPPCRMYPRRSSENRISG